MKKSTSVFTKITLLSQLGIALIVPLLLCLFFCSWLMKQFHLGLWIYLPGFIFGLGSSAMTAYKIYVMIMKQEKMENINKKNNTSYNKHL